MYRALVFDIGNTLVRTADSIEAAYLAVFARHGIPPEAIRLFKRFAGRPKHLLFAEALGDRPGAADLVRVCLREFEAILVDEARRLEAMPGAVECLQAVGGRGWRVALASGFPRAVGRAILDRFGWHYPLVCDEDVAAHRPAPDPVVKASALVGATPTETVIVGDTPQDVLSAQAAGAQSVAVATGKFTREELAAAGAGFVIAGLGELPALLDREFPRARAAGPAP